MKMRTLILGVAVTAVVAHARVAGADEVVGGLVVKLDRREIYVNLGAARGVESGATIRLKRPITLRHPVTRRPVTDWLPLGSGTVTDAGSALTRVALDAGLLAQIKVGDVAEIYVERTEAPPPPVAPPVAPPPEPDRPFPQIDPDTAQVLQVWRAITGASLDARIAAWDGWLATHAASPYAEAIRADLEVLRATQQAMAPDRGRVDPRTVRIEHNGPRRMAGGRPAALAFVLAEPAAVTAATLHARTVGQPTFRRVELTREHGIYLRGALPAELVIAPGVEYFVEVTRADGSTTEAYGSARSPAAVTIAPPALVTRFTPTRKRTRLSLLASYLDFASLDRRTEGGVAVDRSDRFAQTEIDVLYRLDGLLYGVRAGFGAYGGRGGFANRIWTEANPAPIIGFQYGYAEAELRFPIEHGPSLGLAGRFTAGVGRDGFGVGVAGRARLGDPDRTNLSVGVSGVEQLGFFTDLRLETWPGAQLPIGISVGVTDQPGNGDLGVRLATEIGWRPRPWVQPTVRLSWQGRTAAHSGVGGGLGLVFDW